MEPSRFDELTKALATSTSRRQALKTIAATTLGGLLGLGGIGTAFAKPKCHRAGTGCDTNSQCCSGLYCANGEKSTPCPALPACNSGSPCPQGQTCQNGQCVADPCKNVLCGVNEMCVGGNCVPKDPCAGVTCGAGEVCSNGTCVATSQPLA